MRRILALAVVGVVVLAACSDDDSSSPDTTPVMSLVENTTPDVVDKCADDYVPPSTEVTGSSVPASEVTGSQVTGSSVPTSEVTGSAAPESTEGTTPGSTEGSTLESTVPESTEGTTPVSTEGTTSEASTPASSTPESSTPESTTPESTESTSPGSSQPTGTETTGTETTGTETTGTETTGTETTGTDVTGSDVTGSDVTETTEDAYAEVPDVNPPDEAPTELVRTVLSEGSSDGPEAADGDVVSVYYVGVLQSDGTQFDTNFGSGQPLTFAVGAGQVIDGWDQGLVGAKPGDQIQLDIPSDLAYGDQGSGDAIPPGSALTFVIDVVDVKPVPTLTPPAETSTELDTTVVTEGPSDGHAANAGDVISFDFVGVLQSDGTQFANTYASGTPTQITLGDAKNITAWNEGLDGAKVGDEIQLDVPADLAYGVAGSPDGAVPANAAVSFLIVVTDVVDVPDVTLPDGRVTDYTTTVIEEGPGEGRAAQKFDTLSVYFAAELSADGTQVGGNFGTPAPTPMVLGNEQFLPGLDDQLSGVHAGDVVQVDVPAADALGDAGSGDGTIPPDADLSFVFQIEDVTGPPILTVPDDPSTELDVTVNTEGSGPEAADGDTVLVNYVGVIQDGNERFASNWDGEVYPVSLGAGDVIEGWDEGLVGVQAGEELQLDVPADLAYGADGQGDTVPPDAALSFLFDVVAIVPADAADNAPTADELPDTPPDVTDLITGDLETGDGAELTEGSSAYIDLYVVCAHTNTVLDNTYDDDQRVVVDTAQGQLVEGLRQGLIGMKVGGRRYLTVPASLAFADAGNDELGVAPGEDLTFVVTLYGVTAPPAGP